MHASGSWDICLGADSRIVLCEHATVQLCAYVCTYFCIYSYICMHAACKEFCSFENCSASLLFMYIHVYLYVCMHARKKMRSAKAWQE